MLQPHNFKFMDRRPRNGNERVRASRKTYADLKFVCDCVKAKVVELGRYSEEMDERACVEMFDAVATEDNGLLGSTNGRVTQSQWRSAVRQLRRQAQG